MTTTDAAKELREAGPCTVYYLEADKEWVIATTWQAEVVAWFSNAVYADPEYQARRWAEILNTAYRAGKAALAAAEEQAKEPEERDMEPLRQAAYMAVKTWLGGIYTNHAPTYLRMSRAMDTLEVVASLEPSVTVEHEPETKR